ncbi:MAG TPA: murein biosynthesis integral membrane protein MurJ [Terriglobales bacterium]|nr:murein biosynthesis integral membrane protein MurJ [Terriglobales bacterium]
MSNSQVTDKSGVQQPRRSGTRAAAVMVAAGMLLSRIAGLIRERAFAHYLGTSDAADAFRAAFRIPNFLQNLFGEGVLSASFIPVYARLDAEGRHEEASELAEAIFSLLFVTTTAIVALGIFFTPWLIDAVAPGFGGEKRLLTINLVQILFPGAGLLVFSAWCLGILNSHRKFFLSYAAPVAWNAILVAVFIWKGAHLPDGTLVVWVAWASVAGSGLQFLVQLPVVLRFLWPLRAHMRLGSENVRTVVRNFFPVFTSRGVVQISAYVDQLLASYLPIGAVAVLGYAQTLSTLPVSLFGMAVSAAELPAMSSALGTADEIAATLRRRVSQGLEQISYFVVPSAVAFLLLGDVVAATIYRSGQFGATDVNWAWGVLAGSGVGLLASTSGRLYSSAFYALRDTRTPLNFAIIRIALTISLGYLFALPLPPTLGIDRRWGVAGLTLSAGIAGWVEFVLLRRSLHKRVGVVPYSVMRIFKLWAAAVVAAAAGYAIKVIIPSEHPVVVGACVLVPYGMAYLLLTSLMGISTIGGALRALRRR